MNLGCYGKGMIPLSRLYLVKPHSKPPKQSKPTRNVLPIKKNKLNKDEILNEQGSLLQL